jgi:enoyl-CoA hydratase/carnithine racemase
VLEHVGECSLAVHGFGGDGADRIGQDDGIEAVLGGLDRGRSYAVVGGEPRDDHALGAELAQPFGEIGSGESGVAVGPGIGPFLDDCVDAFGIEVGMEFRAGCSFHAMGRPRSPLLDEGRVSRRMNVLRREDVPEARHKRVDHRNDVAAVRNRERAPGAEVVLHVDDDEGVGVGDVHTYTVSLMSEVVRVERHDAVAVVRIDRPKVNALNADVVSGLADVCAEIEDDRGIRAAVVYGGERTFSVGADLKEMAVGSAEDVRQRVGALQRVCDRIEALRVPTIAAVNGYALGGGCEIAMACDFRFAATAARLGQPEIVVGLIPGAGGTQRLPRLIGLSRAKWMIYTGEFVDAPTAHAWGLVDEVVDGDAFERALEAAARYASGPTLSLGAAKRVIHRGLDGPLSAGLALELDEFAALFFTDDTRHGLESFAKEGPGKAKFEGR